MAAIFWALANWIEDLPPFEREFDRKDPLIDHTHKSNQYATYRIDFGGTDS